MASFLAGLAGEGLAQPVEAIGNVLDKLFTSDGEKLDKKAVLTRLAQQPQIAQVELNKIEAQHRTVFVAGWRPFIGWVCGVGLAAYFIPQYVMGAFVWVKACLAVMETAAITAGNITTVLPPYPVEPDGLLNLVLALLGLGGMRTFEKFAGRAK